MGLDDFELEPSEHEPEEWDPEDDLYDPEAPGVTIPQVETDESDAPKEVVRTFWTVVLVVNVALFLVSVGPMLIYFEGWIREGAAMIAGGIILFGLAFRRYRAFERTAPADSIDTATSASAENPSDRDQTSTDARGRTTADRTDGPKEDAAHNSDSTSSSHIHEDSS